MKYVKLYEDFELDPFGEEDWSEEDYNGKFILHIQYKFHGLISIIEYSGEFYILSRDKLLCEEIPVNSNIVYGLSIGNEWNVNNGDMAKPFADAIKRDELVIDERETGGNWKYSDLVKMVGEKNILIHTT